MNDPKQNQNTPHQTQALIRFRALNFIEDLQRGGCILAEALRQTSLHPWPDENGDYYAVRTLEDWWYAYKKGGFDALVQEPRSDQGRNRALDDATAAWVLEQVTQNPTVPLKVLYSHWQQNQRPLPSISVLYRYLRRQGLDRQKPPLRPSGDRPHQSLRSPARQRPVDGGLLPRPHSLGRWQSDDHPVMRAGG